MRRLPEKMREKMWKPGQSGNPGGRPKKQVTDRYAKLLEKGLPEDERKKLGLRKGATYGDAVALQQIRRAINGSYNDARELREAIEGKAPQRIELSGGDAPVQIEESPRVDLGKLSKDQLAAYKQILAAAAGRDD